MPDAGIEEYRVTERNVFIGDVKTINEQAFIDQANLHGEPAFAIHTHKHGYKCSGSAGGCYVYNSQADRKGK